MATSTSIIQSDMGETHNNVQALGGPPQLQVTRTLGTVRTHEEHTNQRILIPQPSDDPNDPLNWSKAYKIYIAFLVSMALVLSNFFTAGPGVTLIEVATDLFDVEIPNPANPASLAPTNLARFAPAISKSAYLFSGAALTQGISNLIWIPLAIKYGRRPVYFLTFAMFTVMCIWAAQARSFGSLLAARVLGGWFAGVAECVVPLTIADVYFLHERAQYMALYSLALSSGGAIGCVIVGSMSISCHWNEVYYLLFGLNVAVTAMIYFTMPETYFSRNISQNAGIRESRATDDEKDGTIQVELKRNESGYNNVTRTRSTCHKLRLFNGSLTRESLFRITVRPIAMLAVPSVLWATACLGIGIGIFVVLSTTVPTAFTEVYHFSTWQIGQVWWACVIGGLIGMPVGGIFSDWIANYLSKRNNGIREPEFRLPALVPAMIAYPGALIMYGVSLHYQAHWIVPTIAIGIFAFGLAASGSVTMVYTIDAYRPIAGEVIVTQMGIKAAVAFLMGFYANPWIQNNGYIGSFCAMAGISLFVTAGWIPMYIWGKQLRHSTMKWRILKIVFWDSDRETGE